MSDQTSLTNSVTDTRSFTRTQRIQTFIVTLSVLTLAFLALGLLDLGTSSLTLILSLVAYAYYAVYYMLLRAGYGVPATYGCVALLLVLVGVGIHNSGGHLTAANAIYLLLLVGAGMVLNDSRAIDIVAGLCIVSYGTIVFYELAVEPPPILRDVYLNGLRLFIFAITVSMLVALVGIWLLMRSSISWLHRSTAALEAARAEAEARARENAALVAQVQTSNESLLATQARLRDTIEALTLPLIPLRDGVVLLPLIGYLDDVRAQRFVDGLLHGIHEQRAKTVILDITGLREVDARVAATLLQATNAARLLGARVVLSGVGAISAQALVDLDANLGGLQTTGRLSDALQIATAAGAR